MRQLGLPLTLNDFKNELANKINTWFEQVTNRLSDGPVFRAYDSAASRAMVSATYNKATLDTESFDSANCFASSRFTPNVAGYYQITGTVSMAGNSATLWIPSIWKNGSHYQNGNSPSTSASSNAQSLTVTALVYLNGSTDYVELYGWINGTSTVFWGSGSTIFSGYLVRAA